MKRSFIACHAADGRSYTKHSFQQKQGGPELTACRRCGGVRRECQMAQRKNWKAVHHADMVAQGRDINDPAFRRRRAISAGNAARASYWRRHETTGEKFSTKAEAYRAGYYQGYRTALNWWQRKVSRDAVKLRKAS